GLTKERVASELRRPVHCSCEKRTNQPPEEFLRTLRERSGEVTRSARFAAAAQEAGVFPWHLTMSLSGRPPRPELRRERTLSSSARGAQPQARHGPLQAMVRRTSPEAGHTLRTRVPAMRSCKHLRLRRKIIKESSVLTTPPKKPNSPRTAVGRYRKKMILQSAGMSPFKSAMRTPNKYFQKVWPFLIRK